MDRAYAASKEEVLQHFHVDPEKGLSQKQINDARSKYGTNGTAGIPLA